MSRMLYVEACLTVCLADSFGSSDESSLGTNTLSVRQILHYWLSQVLQTTQYCSEQNFFNGVSGAFSWVVRRVFSGLEYSLSASHTPIRSTSLSQVLQTSQYCSEYHDACSIPEIAEERVGRLSLRLVYSPYALFSHIIRCAAFLVRVAARQSCG